MSLIASVWKASKADSKLIWIASELIASDLIANDPDYIFGLKFRIP